MILLIKSCIVIVINGLLTDIGNSRIFSRLITDWVSYLPVEARVNQPYPFPHTATPKIIKANILLAK